MPGPASSRVSRAAVLLLAGTALLSVATPGFGQDASARIGSAPASVPVPRQKLNTSGQAIDLVVPLRERVPLGQVAVRIAPDDSVTVALADLAAALGRSATATFLDRIRAVPASDGYASLEALSAVGLKLAFDPAALDLTASFDASGRPDRTVGLGFARDGVGVLPDTSSDFAAYLSYQGSMDWIQRGTDTGLRRPIANFDLNGRLFNLVSFENQFTYDGNRGPSFSRYASRLIYDRPGSSLRFQAGDLFSIPQVFQDQPELAGFGVSKLLREFRPDRVYTTSAGRRITLNDPATVTVIINGAPSQTLRLDPGNYNLEDLPLTGGANNVQLLIEDPAGGRRLVTFDFFLDSELLARGIDEYDAKLGIRSDYEDGRRAYLSKEPLVTGFYRRGLSEQLTAGANLQATRSRQQLGGEAIFGTPVGLFTANASLSHLRGFGSGYAARLQYRYSSPLAQELGARRIDIFAEHRSENFGGVETERPFNSNAWFFSGRYSQPVTRRLSFGLGADYQIGRNGERNRYAVRGSAGYSLSNGMQVNASAGFEQRAGFVFGATFFWRRTRNTLVTAQYDSRIDDARVGYFYSPQRPIDAIAWNLEASRTNGIAGLNGTAVWRTNRGDFELSHRAALLGGDRDSRIMQSSARVRGTLAFADGQFALGRYLTDSFAIIAPHRSLKGAQVLVGSRVSEQVDARSGTLGPALVPLSSYSPRAVYFNVPDAPDGYSIGEGNESFFAWLHSGHRVVVGSDYNVTVIGTLLDARGDPVSLIAGTARRTDIAQSPTVPIFTNRDGKLGASGLSPGRWQITAGDNLYDLVIPVEADSFVDLATLRPTGRREKRP
ncbi:hypothetical protein GCM10022280_08920 [Sphingomonas swuensis]|uniref:Fimbrial biogenesis outer membrane usher protein n=1 Tax=Sphingomonas swuensis TaxID=977800 RepID=A0ABP7SKL1_9SPHN